MLIRKIKDILKNFIYRYYPKRCIIFESAPDFADNSRAVFDEMVRRGMNQKYKMVWIAYDQNTRLAPKAKNAKAILPDSKQLTFSLCTAKAIITCNRYMGSYFKDQFSIYLDHGCPFKNISNIIRLPDTLTAYNSCSLNTAELSKKYINIPNTVDVQGLGFPRNDAYSLSKINLRHALGWNNKKIIVWYPTFRQHKGGIRVDGGNALPIIHNLEWAKQINDVLQEQDVLLVLKPHFAQKVDCIKDLNFSNIKFIDDTFYKENNFSSYEFLNSCDAIISDYSSVHYDFLLADQPIALIWEDIEEYKKNPGLVDNYEFLASGTEKIYTVDDFIQFINDVVNGVDRLSSQRHEIRDWVHISTDGKNSERVVDFIIERAKL